MATITKNSNGLSYPVKTGTAPGLVDGLYLSRSRNHLGQVIDSYVAVLSETVVGSTWLYDQLGNHLADQAAAILVPGRMTVGVGNHKHKDGMGVYYIPDSAQRAAEMARANGYSWE